MRQPPAEGLRRRRYLLTKVRFVIHARRAIQPPAACVRQAGYRRVRCLLSHRPPAVALADTPAAGRSVSPILTLAMPLLATLAPAATGGRRPGVSRIRIDVLTFRRSKSIKPEVVA